ncbi:MAG: DUF177 domain-containing protein [Bdellovibrionota bacterium]
MRIRIADIPPEGRELDFELRKESVNARVGSSREPSADATAQGPTYTFLSNPHVHVRLMLEGSTVVISGNVKGEYVTQCARCAEDAKRGVSTPLDLVLKPQSGRSEDAEDLHFGTYSGEEIECSDFAEEFLVLSLPFTVLCDDKCKGLCPQCGKNLNMGACDCKPEPTGDPRLSVLRELKIH